MKLRSMTLAVLAAALCGPSTLLAVEDSSGPAAKTETPAVDAAKADTRCTPSTQSRLRPSKATGCQGAQPTRSFSREELQSTGQIDLAEALRRLDPRFR